MFFLALVVIASFNTMQSSDIGKMLVPGMQKQLPIITHKVHKPFKPHSGNIGIAQFNAADCITGGIFATSIISIGFTIAGYYEIIPNDALLAQINAKKADENIVHYLKKHYLNENFPFEKIYVSDLNETPAVFGKNTLIVPQSWEKEILAYQLIEKIELLKKILSKIEETSLEKTRIMRSKKKLEAIVEKPLMQALIEQEKDMRALRFQVFLPHEGEHVKYKDNLKQSLVWLGVLVPPAIGIACGFPDCMLDSIENLSMMSEIGIKTIMTAGYYKAYKKGIVAPFVRYREKKADEAILNKELGIQYFKRLAEEDDSKSDTHPRPSERAEYLKQIVAKETRNDI